MSCVKLLEDSINFQNFLDSNLKSKHKTSITVDKQMRKNLIKKFREK